MKHIFFLILAFAVSINAYAESYIPYKGGKLLLFALPGCGGPSDPKNMMYGLWERVDGGKEMLCWSYNETVSIYYADGKEQSFLPTEVRREEDISSKKQINIPSEISLK